jgi:hypothetical protein
MEMSIAAKKKARAQASGVESSEGRAPEAGEQAGTFSSTLPPREQRIVNHLLIVAANEGEAYWVRAHLAEGADPNASRDNRGASALMLAMKHGSEVVEELLAAGADPSYASDGELGRTCLHEAILHGPEVVAALLEAGADPLGRSLEGFTALQTAVSSHYDEDVQKKVDGSVMSMLAAGMPQEVLDGALFAATRERGEKPGRRWIVALATAGADISAMSRHYVAKLSSEELAAFEARALGTAVPRAPKGGGKRI